MPIRFLAHIACLPPAALLVAAHAPAAGTLVVEVGNVRNAHGIVHVDLCEQATFLKDHCPFSGEAPATPGTTRVTITGAPAGSYAAQAFHDENLNGKVDRGLFGVPKEGIGFSRDAPIHLGPPRWAEAVFGYAGAAQTIGFRMRYMAGASHPDAKR